MKINFDTVLKDLQNKAMIDEKGNPFSLRDAVTNALLLSFTDEPNLQGADKIRRFQLATKIQGAKSIDLLAEEIALAKACVGKAYGPLVVGRAYELLDPA